MTEWSLEVIVDPDLQDEGRPEHRVCVVVDADGHAIVAMRSEAEDTTELREWVTINVPRFYEHGPDFDGWQERSDGRWQLWLRTVYLPDL
jgi:prophage antirepressor-like protein